MKPQYGLALWPVLFLLLAIASLTAVAGWLFLQDVDQSLNPQTPPASVTLSQAGNAPSAPQDLTPPPQGPTSLLVPGEAGAGGGHSESDDEEAPVTQIDLTLKGIIVRLDPEQSRALIAVGKQAEQAYLPGNSVLADVELEQVNKDHVVLRVKGRRETLYLNRTLSGQRFSYGSTQSLADADPGPSYGTEIPADDAPDPTTSSSEEGTAEIAQDEADAESGNQHGNENGEADDY